MTAAPGRRPSRRTVHRLRCARCGLPMGLGSLTHDAGERCPLPACARQGGRLERFRPRPSLEELRREAWRLELAGELEEQAPAGAVQMEMLLADPIAVRGPAGRVVLQLRWT